MQKDKQDTFFKLCNWLDDQTKMFTVTALHEKLCSITGLSDTYSIGYLQEQYREHKFFADLPGKTNTVCF